jgi:hypothetical protein
MDFVITERFFVATFCPIFHTVLSHFD